jgi:hypothetical protein
MSGLVFGLTFGLNVQERNEKDAMQYAAELKELQRTLDHDEKLKDFLFHKSNDRAFAADLVSNFNIYGSKLPNFLR